MIPIMSLYPNKDMQNVDLLPVDIVFKYGYTSID